MYAQYPQRDKNDSQISGHLKYITALISQKLSSRLQILRLSSTDRSHSLREDEGKMKRRICWSVLQSRTHSFMLFFLPLIHLYIWIISFLLFTLVITKKKKTEKGRTLLSKHAVMIACIFSPYNVFSKHCWKFCHWRAKCVCVKSVWPCAFFFEREMGILVLYRCVVSLLQVSLHEPISFWFGSLFPSAAQSLDPWWRHDWHDLFPFLSIWLWDKNCLNIKQ